jgi:hypothetical protein
MSLSGTTRKDRFLTNIAQTYPTGSLIGSIAAPIRPVARYADTVFADADDVINLVNDVAENAPSNGINFQVGSGYSYRTTRKALDTTILDKTVRNEEDIVNSKIRETKKLTHRLRLKHEYRVAAILTSSSKVTQYAALSSTDRWDNASYANNFLTKKIVTAVGQIHSACGCQANTLIVPFEAALYLAQDTAIRTTLGYQYGMQVVSAGFQGQAMRLVGLPPVIGGLNVVVADARYNNANEGETASKANIWGKNCLIGYVPPMNSVEDTYGVVTMEYEPFSVYEERMTNPRGSKIITEWDYDILEADLTTWYLFTDVIS